MKTQQVVGMLLLIAGAGAIIYGLSIQNSLEYKFAKAFGGGGENVIIMMVIGIIVAIIGMTMLLTNRGNSEQEREEDK